jgi:hypothetical protein
MATAVNLRIRFVLRAAAQGGEAEILSMNALFALTSGMVAAATRTSILARPLAGIVAVVLLASCSPKADAVPHATSITPAFLRDINDVDESDPEDFVIALENVRYQRLPPKDEFETSAQYKARLNAAASKLHLPTGLFAFVKKVDFTYDADNQTATINDPDNQELYLFTQVGLSSEKGPMPEDLSFHLPVQVAEQARTGDDVRLALIFKIDPKAEPMLAGDRLAPLHDAAMAAVRENLKQGSAYTTPPEIAAEVHARTMLMANVVRLIVYRKSIGPSRPLYVWEPSA